MKYRVSVSFTAKVYYCIESESPHSALQEASEMLHDSPPFEHGRATVLTTGQWSIEDWDEEEAKARGE